MWERLERFFDSPIASAIVVLVCFSMAKDCFSAHLPWEGTVFVFGIIYYTFSVLGGTVRWVRARTHA